MRTFASSDSPDALAAERCSQKPAVRDGAVRDGATFEEKVQLAMTMHEWS